MGLTDKILKIGVWGAIGFFIIAIVLSVIYLLIPTIISTFTTVDVNPQASTQLEVPFPGLVNETKSLVGVFMTLAIVLGAILSLIAQIAAIIEIIGLKIKTSTKIIWAVGLLLIRGISEIALLLYYFKFRKEYLKIESNKKSRT